MKTKKRYQYRLDSEGGTVLVGQRYSKLSRRALGLPLLLGSPARDRDSSLPDVGFETPGGLAAAESG
jgi:hypothetical protein